MADLVVYVRKDHIEVVNLKNAKATTGSKIVLLLACIGWIGGCASAAPSKAPPVVVGSDRDVHGCKASAGYTWCAREQMCVRSWELAHEKGFERGGDAFKQYCDANTK